jgi:teichuronic acid biosynthesis glycosyltransferase TuaG
MKKTPLVSVIVNCFNSEETILRAVTSVLNQTQPNLEIIVWDNGSTDSTLSLVSSLNDKRIKLFKNNKTVSLGIARNFAINQAEGKYTAFCDSDDWWCPEKLQVQLEILEESNYSFVCSDFKIIDLINNSTSTKYKDRKSSVITECDLVKDYNVGLLTLLTYTESIKKIIRDDSPEYMYIWDFDIVLKLSREGDGYFIAFISAYNTISSSTLSVTGRVEAKKELGAWLLSHYEIITQSCPNSIKYINYKIAQCIGITNSKIHFNYFSLLNVLVIKIYLKVKVKVKVKVNIFNSFL